MATWADNSDIVGAR